MKTLRFSWVMALVVLFSLQAVAQLPMTSPSGNVLFTANGQQYTQDHFNKEVRFVEFIIGAPMTEGEKQLGLQETAQSFSFDPAGVIQAAQEVDTQMQQILQLTDVAQIGRMRSGLIYQIYSGTQHLQQKPFIVQLMMKYVPLLAFDASNTLAFTAGDCQAFIQLMQLQAQMAGQNAQLNAQQINEIQQSLVQQFPYLSLEQKQSLCGMQVLYGYLSNVYAQMTPEQKQQMQTQMVQQQMAQQQQQLSGADAAFAQGVQQAQQQAAMEAQWPAGAQTPEQKQAYLQQMRGNMNANAAAMNIYNDTMMGTHATMLNTIENFGDTGAYWEYK
jgi:hypothetical protein